MIVPLSEVGPNDAPAQLGAGTGQQFLPKIRNYAEDPAVKALVQNEISPMLRQTRADRLTLDLEWQQIRRMEMLQPDGNQAYEGRSKAYVPVYAKALDTNVTQLSAGLFPSDEYMDVLDRNGQTGMAEQVKAYMQWELERVARLRAVIKPMLRTLVAYGNSPVKYIYRRQRKYVGKTRKMGGGYGAQFVPTANLDGLLISPRSPFNVYVYPVVADSLDEAIAVFEDLQVTQAYVEEQKYAGTWFNTEELAGKGVSDPPEFLQNQQQQILDSNNSMNSQAYTLQGKKYTGVLTVTECWMNIVLPADAYLEGEDPRCPIPAQIVLSGNTVLRVTRNPYFHQQAPYRYARMNVSPGNFYGSGVGRRTMSLQYLVNDFLNQTNDCGTYSLNPIGIVNRSVVSGELPPLAPGIMLEVNDTPGQAIQFITPPTQLWQFGNQIVQALTMMAQDASGAPPVLQGAKSADTATSTAILQRNAMGPLKDIVEDLEVDVLVPILHGAWSNAQQFRDKSVLAYVAGAPVQISPEQIEIDADFKWLASNQAMNAQQRAQQITQLLQIMNPQMVAQIQQQGYSVNFEALLKQLWTDGYGFRNFKDFVSPVQGGQPGVSTGANPMAPGQPGGPSQIAPAGGAPSDALPVGQDGGRVRSALEQVTGADDASPMAPGEGEDFMNTRANSDHLSSLFSS